MKPIIWVVAACLAAGVQAAEILGEEVEKISRVEDLVGILESTQRFLQGISPPSSEIHVAREKVPLPVDWSGFDKKTTKYMTATMDEYGLPRYGLLLWEDVATRERVVALSSTGYEIVRIPAPEDYQPEAYYTAMLSGGGTYSETMRWIFDPAHTAVEIELIPEALYSAYEQYEAEKVAQQELLAAREAVPVPEEESDSIRVGISLVPAEELLSTEEPESDFLMSTASIPMPPGDTNSVPGCTNCPPPVPQNVELAISTPEGYGHMGHIEIFAKDDLVYSSSWGIADDWVSTYGNQTVYWTDPVSSNKMQRFYFVSDGADMDGDFHSDLYEAWEGGTDSNSFDLVNTDGDDLHDWLELKIFGDLSQTGTNDFDEDGLLNGEELVVSGQTATMLSNPALADSDADGFLNDYQERRVWNTDAMDPDTDNDGRTDAEEILGSPKTNPKNPDTVSPVVAMGN